MLIRFYNFDFPTQIECLEDSFKLAFLGYTIAMHIDKIAITYVMLCRWILWIAAYGNKVHTVHWYL